MTKEISIFIYVGSFIISSLLVYLGIGKTRLIKTGYTVLGISLPVILATFRSVTVGIDTAPYYYLYQTYSSFPTLAEKFRILGFKEFINTILIHVCSKVGGFNLYLFFFAMATLIVTIIALYNILPGSDVAIGYFLYLCFFFSQLLNIMRQGLAVALIFLSYKFIIDRKLVKFILIIILASGVHISALVMLPMYFVINRKKELNKLVIGSMAFVLAIFSLSPSGFFIIISKIPGFDRYSFYAAYSGDVNNRIFILNLMIFIIIFILRKYLLNKNQYNKFLLVFLGFGLLIGASGFTSPFIKRIGVYFDVFQIVLITELSSIFSSKIQSLIIRYSVCLMGILYFIISSYVLGLAQILPYSFQIY